MSNFNAFRITSKGLDLQYKAQSGKPLKFSKFVLGDGYYDGVVRDLNALVSPIREESITRLNITGVGNSKKLIIGFDLNTKNVMNGFYLREIGIYAKDPDTNEDILMFYTNAGETADYIASNSSNNVAAKLINVELYISDVSEITAIINDSLVYATANDIQELNKKLEDKVTKVMGKDLSTNDYTDADKQKLNNLPENFITIEKDPTVPMHVKNISEQDITNWNDKADVDQLLQLTYDTQELEPGVSSLTTGAIHLTYE